MLGRAVGMDRSVRRSGAGESRRVVTWSMPRCRAGSTGRPITDEEVVGLVQLLVLGGLETTAGALGLAMVRMCNAPEIPAQLARQPELIPRAIEEFLRLETPFIAEARTAIRDTEIDGHRISQGDKVLIYWTSAGRDEDEFPDPDVFTLDRPKNRHLAFGAGIHRCAGSNLARMNMRIALAEIVDRFRT